MGQKVYEEYLEFEFKNGRAYARKDKIELFENVDAAIFDCDGVLIDTKGSYDRTLSWTVAYILEGFTAHSFPKDMIPNEIISIFKNSGGFNSDWDICYSILMFILCNLPEDYLKILKPCLKSISSQQNPSERFLLIKNAIRRGKIHKKISENNIKRQIEGLKSFARNLDESGVLSADRELLRYFGSSMKGFYEDLKRILYYPPEFGKSIIPTVYEETFCGSELTTKIYGVKSIFRKGPGLIENERVIIKPETFDRLTSIFGKANFGIASGSRLIPARYVLGDIFEYFNPNASVFLEDIEKEERISKSKKGMPNSVKQSSLMKPNPFSLIKAAKGLEPFTYALYVGDSIEDAITTERAKEKDPRFIFAGAYAYFSYRYPGFEDFIVKSFLESGVDLILPSVNELPQILNKVRETS